jgi:hypothetical protein
MYLYVPMWSYAGSVGIQLCETVFLYLCVFICFCLPTCRACLHLCVSVCICKFLFLTGISKFTVPSKIFTNLHCHMNAIHSNFMNLFAENDTSSNLNWLILRLFKGAFSNVVRRGSTVKMNGGGTLGLFSVMSQHSVP